MPDYQRLVDNIRSVLASSGGKSNEVAETLAVEFAAACKAVNGRLRVCGDLLHKGLRSEAIQQCEVEPNLLQLVAILDFSELADWIAYLDARLIEPGEPLLTDVAADLNEAYSQEQPLATLLRRHRLLALGRGAMRERVSTLRKLARLDINNTVWQDDLRVYERARQQEIRQSAGSLVKQGDVAALENACNDLQQPDWLDPPPADLVQSVTASYARLVRTRSRTELTEIEPQLADAFAQFDVAAGRSLRQRWNACLVLAGLPDDDALLYGAAPALEWLADQDRVGEAETSYKTALADLEQALDDEAGLTALDRLAHAALRFDRPLPALLEQRLRARVASLELDRSRRMRLIGGGALVAVLLFAGGIGFAIHSHQQGEQIAANAASLRALLDNQMLVEAEKHFDQLSEASPAIAAAPEIQRLRTELATLKQEEESRQTRFRHAIEAAETAGAEEPDRKSLADAKQLARLVPEKARVARLENLVAAAQRKRQQEIDERFAARLKDLSDRVAKLAETRVDDDALSGLRQEFLSLLRESPEVSPGTKALSTVLEARLDALTKAQNVRHLMADGLKSVAAKLGDPDAFQRALTEYADAFPEGVRAVDFKRAVAEQPAWKTIEVWNRFLDKWQSQDITLLSGANASELIAACKAVLAEHSGYPTAADLLKRMPYLESVVRRGKAGDASPLIPLQKFLADALITGLWMVESNDADGNALRYYLSQAPRERKSAKAPVALAYIIDFSTASTRPGQIPPDGITYNEAAPQSLLSKSIMDDLAKLGDHNWEVAFFKIAQRITTQERLEPILTVLFLQKVMNVARQGSDVLNSSFTEYQKVLDSAAIDATVKWMDPVNNEARRSRELAKGHLARLPALLPLRDDIAKKLKALKSPLGPKHEWVGCLIRGDDGKWTCRVKESPKVNGQLVVAIPEVAEKRMRWVEVGQVKSGKCELRAASPESFVEGRPVYAAVSTNAHEEVRPSGGAR
jgi:hypothetical protein